ncbi:MAG: transglycosylase SLT domain-containing protein [Polyangiaceae bacterium]
MRPVTLRRTLLALTIAAGALGCGCGTAEPVPQLTSSPPAAKSAAPPVLASATATASATASAAPAAPIEIGFDPATAKPLLDDPRFATVKLAVGQEAYVKAVELMQALIAGPPGPSADEKPGWLYQLGRLRNLAGDPLGAAKAFEDSADLGGVLQDYARYQAADLYERAGKHDKALALAKKVPAKGLGLADELELVTASALEGTGDIEGAAVVWRAHLARSPRPWGWINVTLKFAGALMKHPTVAHNEEAVKLARTIIDGSSSAGVGEAKDIEKKALGLLPSNKRKALETPTSDSLLTRAKRLLSAGQVKEALKVTELLQKPALTPKSKEKQCDARILRGDALGRNKQKAESADAYEEAVDLCKDTPRHVDALFLAGKGLASTGRIPKGLARLEEVEKLYPTHKLADDARVRRAMTALANGDELTYAKLLTSLPDDYPQGSSVNDGLFELGVHYAEKKLWAAALVPLTRAFEIEKDKRERVYYQAGRFGYFLGRAFLENGSEAKGKETLAGVIQNYPLSYYMALAYARLFERDPAAAKKALQTALDRESAEAFYVPPHPALKSASFARAVELVRQGDAKLARGELDVLGLGDRTAPREVLWASALLLAQAGAPTASTGILRSASSTPATSTHTELTDWLEHYPAGKWRTAWELSFPRPYAEIVTAATKDAQIPEALAYAIMREESGFDPRVVSGAQAYGLMQLILPTAKRMAKPLNLPYDAESLKKPAVNIPLGCRYLGQLRKQFPDNVLLSIPGYNAGGGAPKKWLGERAGYDFDVWVERIPYDETQKYTKRVIGSMAAYEWLYFQEQPTEARATPKLAGAVPSAAASASALPGNAAPTADPLPSPPPNGTP